jgi:hypothetical protein
MIIGLVFFSIYVICHSLKLFLRSSNVKIIRDNLSPLIFSVLFLFTVFSGAVTFDYVGKPFQIFDRLKRSEYFFLKNQQSVNQQTVNQQTVNLDASNKSKALSCNSIPPPPGKSKMLIILKNFFMASLFLIPPFCVLLILYFLHSH